MKSKRIFCGLLTIVCTLSLFPQYLYAASVQELKQQEENAKIEGSKINAEIDTVVEDINQKYKELAKIQEDVTSNEKVIRDTKDEVEVIESSIDKRTELIASRMQDMQVKSLSQSSLQTILESENFSEFLSRFYAVTVLQNAEKSKVDSLFNDKERLDGLKDKLQETKVLLKEKQGIAESEKQTLDVEVKKLQTKLAENTETLQSLTEQRIQKENDIRREAEERAKKEAEEKEKEKAKLQKVKAENQKSSSPQTIERPSKVPPVTLPEPIPNASSSSAMSGSATAYIATGFNTATGTVPTAGRTIAVDSSVIPLGSRVMIEVPSSPQYSGVYTAEDTGGAVKGTIIDIFVGSYSEALQFGRREIKITILG